MNTFSLVATAAVLALSSCTSTSDQAEGTGPNSTNNSSEDTANVSAESFCNNNVDSFRTDLTSSGNRVSDVQLDVATAEVIDISLDGAPLWVLPYDSEGSWHVTLDTGDAVVVNPDGSITDADAPPAGEAPELITSPDSDIEVASALKHHGLFNDPLPDARVVTSGDNWAVLADPTERYDHGVLGDAIEASAVEIVNVCTDETTLIEVSESDVIEGISPILADLDGDGQDEVLITVSNSESGARLVAYDLGGSLIAESDPIGQGNRWRNQMAVAPLGADGAVEIVDVRVPHIGGVVEFFRLEGGSLVKRAEVSEFTSHVIRTRNLDMGIVVDATDNGRLDVVVPTQDRTELVVITRSEDSADVTTTVEVGGQLVTNISTRPTATGGALAVGTDNNQLRIWQTPAN